MTNSPKTIPRDDPPDIYAVAEAWASVDGKLDEFLAGAKADCLVDEPDGYYSGYIADAEELIIRIHKRGFQLEPLS